MLSIENFICIGLITVIFFFLPNNYVPFEVPKVIAFTYFTQILVLFFVYDFFRNSKKWILDKKIFTSVVLFLTIATLISISGVDFIKSLVGNYYRKDGLMTLYSLVGFSFLITYFWNNDLKRKISISFFIASLTLAIISIIQISLNKFGLGNAVTFGNPVYLAGFLSVSLPFGYYLFKISKRKIYIVGTLTILIAVLLMNVIGANLTMILSITLVTFNEIKSNKKYLIMLVSILLGIVLSVNWLKDYKIKNDNVFIFEGRARIFRNLLVSVQNKPMGYGWSNVDYAFESIVWPIKLNNDIYLDKAHSEFLEILVTTGFIGLLSYLLLLFFILKKSWNLYKKTNDYWYFTLFAILILFIFHSQTNIVSITEQIILWLIVGLNLLDLEEV